MILSTSDLNDGNLIERPPIDQEKWNSNSYLKPHARLSISLRLCFYSSSTADGYDAALSK